MDKGLTMSKQEEKRMGKSIEFKEFDSEVKKLGNSGYIPAPKSWIGRKVHVVWVEKEE